MQMYELSSRLNKIELLLKVHGLNKPNKYKQYSYEYIQYKDIRTFIIKNCSCGNLEHNYNIINSMLNKFTHDFKFLYT